MHPRIVVSAGVESQPAQSLVVRHAYIHDLAVLGWRRDFARAIPLEAGGLPHVVVPVGTPDAVAGAFAGRPAQHVGVEVDPKRGANSA